MKIKSMAAAALAGWCTAGAALAASPYPGAGTMNPVEYTFEAISSGPVTATFLSADAAYTEYLGLAGGPTPVLSNHPGAGDPTTTVLLANATAGQILTFYIYVSTSGATFSSDSALNMDGQSNHVYATPYGGDLLLAFEDLPKGSSDWDYNDAVFTVSNVAVVPEPANLALLMAGLGLVGFMARRRRG